MNFATRWAGVLNAAIGAASEDTVVLKLPDPGLILSLAAWTVISNQVVNNSLSCRYKRTGGCDLVNGTGVYLPALQLASAEQGAHLFSEPMDCDTNDTIDCTAYNHGAGAADVTWIAEYLPLTIDQLAEYRRDSEFRRAIAERLALLRTRT